MLLLTAFTISSVLLSCTAHNSDVMTDDFINSINKKQSHWKAGRNFPKHRTWKQLYRLAGRYKEDETEDVNQHLRDEIYHRIAKLPQFFDVRKKWPQCASLINRIRHQGDCSNCWAISAASTMSDRTCIGSNGTIKFFYSTEDVTTCCRFCIAKQDGVFDPCTSGLAMAAWRRWVDRGFVSGGEYRSSEGCKPFSSSAFLHGIASKCKEECSNPSYGIPYHRDKHYGRISYRIPRDSKQMQTDIFINGPIQSRFAIFDDFYAYRNGVYIHQEGDFSAYHYVKLIGWGEENGVRYWLGLNTWGREFGSMGGLFKFLRGKNHCGIETYVFAGSIQSREKIRKMDSRGSSRTNHSPRIFNLYCYFLEFISFSVITLYTRSLT